MERGPSPPASQQEVRSWFHGLHMPTWTPPTTQDVRDVAATFTRKTSAPDGWHPRQLAHLSEPSLEALSGLFTTWERSGHPDEAIESLVVKMIPKPAGGGADQ